MVAAVMRERWRRWQVPAVLLIGAVSLGSALNNFPTGSEYPNGTVRVFAAASLTEAFTDIVEPFENRYPGIRVEFNFGSSSTLAEQIRAGAPADVLASADEQTTAALVAARQAISATVMARSRLMLVVERGNPKQIRRVADVARPGVVFVMCVAAAPCGRYGDAVLAAAGVDVVPAARAENVKAVLARVVLGEADAGLVYATDVRAAGEAVEGVEIEEAGSAALEVVYTIATVLRPEPPGGGLPDDRELQRISKAGLWERFVTGPEGRAVLRRHGFGPARPE